MKAVGLYRHLPIADPESLVDLELPEPQPTGRDLQVEVRAISVNPVDYKQRMRAAPDEKLPIVLGWDVAGVVRAVGPEATLFRPGDEVYYAGSIQRPGANAQLHLVDERIVGHKPRSLEFGAAAALPLTTLTAWESLFDRLGISPRGEDRGKSILMIGAAGGVGSIAIQLARHLAGLRVIGTASRPESAQWVRELGAEPIDHRRGPLIDQLRALGSDGVDYVLCLTDATEYFPQFADVIRPQGKICLIVSMTAPVQLTPLMSKSATVVWELMFTRSLYATTDMQRQHEILEEVAALIEAGALKTTLSRDLGPINAANLRRAHAVLEEGRTIGKVVLSAFD